MASTPSSDVARTADERLRALEHDLTSAYAALLQRRAAHARVRRAVTLAALVALAVTAVAAASVRLFGWPAPGHVKSDLAAVDQGMPEDLRLRPDVEHARAVAQSGNSTLYVADLRKGGHCYEIVTAGDRGRGATCRTAAEMGAQPIELTLPSDDAGSDTAPVTVGGRVNVGAAAQLSVRYGETGATDRIALGDNGYFVFEVPKAHRIDAHRSAMTFSARTDKDAVLATTTVPADWDGPARPDAAQPIFVNTISDSNDFTKLYGISGHVSVARAVQLELSYRDGEAAKIPLQADGRYSYVVPPARTGDFMVPRTLLAEDAEGHVLARAFVAAVAYWRGHKAG